MNCETECFSDNWKYSFLLLHIFDRRTFSRRVTARWWRQSAKNQVSTNQNSRNRWCLIVRGTVWKDLNSTRFLSSERCFAILDNAWSFWLAFDMFYLYDFQMKSYCLHVFLRVSHNWCCFQWWNLSYSTGTGW